MYASTVEIKPRLTCGQRKAGMPLRCVRTRLSCGEGNAGMPLCCAKMGLSRGIGIVIIQPFHMLCTSGNVRTHKSFLNVDTIITYNLTLHSCSNSSSSPSTHRSHSLPSSPWLNRQRGNHCLRRHSARHCHAAHTTRHRPNRPSCNGAHIFVYICTSENDIYPPTHNIWFFRTEV